MNIALIGAGNLATNLAHALTRAGHKILAVYSRTMQSAQVLSERLEQAFPDAEPVTPTDKLELVTHQAEIYIIAVRDDVLHDVAARLRSLMPDALIVHTAGTMQMDVIPGKGRGVLYPMQTFSKQRIVRFEEIPVFVEAENAADLTLLKELASKISNNVMAVSGHQRKSLHLAAVFCCNFANHCSAIADFLLDEQGIPFNVMLPLIRETTAKLSQCTPREAQTGPAVREDKKVMDNHVCALEKAGHADLAQIYRMMSDSIMAFKQKVHIKNS